MQQTFDEIILIGEAEEILQPLFLTLRAHGYRNTRYISRIPLSPPILRENNRTLLIIDLDTDEYSKIGLVDAVSKANSNTNLEVIALVAKPSPTLVKQLAKAGVSSVLTKPLSAQQLLDRIDDLS